MIEKIVSFSLKNKVLIFIILIFLVLFGAYAYIVADREVFPNVNLDTLIIQASYPNANASEVYNNLTSPIYNSIKSINGIQTIQENANNGFTNLIVTSNYGVDQNSLEQQLNQDIQSVKLPSGVNPPQVSQFNFTDLPILEISLHGTGYQKYAMNTLIPDLNNISGVSQVLYYGNTTRELHINVNYSKLKQYNISYTNFINIIKSFDISSSIGTVNSSNNISRALTIYSNIGSINSLNNAVIGTYQGIPVKLSKVANTKIVEEYRNQIVSTNGKKSIVISITGQQNINTITTIQSLIGKINSTLPKGVHYTTLSNDTQTINSTISGIVDETLQGIILAIIIIFIFLRSSNTTLIASLSIPISFFFALSLMNLQNITFNIMSLSGLSVALGRIVDDSIVVIENIFRHVSENKNPDENVIISSVKEVGGAITSSTLTTIGVFLPIAFVGGITSSFFNPFAFTAVSALIASLFTAIIVIPLFSKMFLLRKNAKQIKEKEFFLSKYYKILLEYSLKHKLYTILITFILVIASLFLINHIQTGFIPSPQQPDAIITGSLPIGTDQKSTEAVTEKITNYLSGINTLSSYTVQVGATSSAKSLNSSVGGLSQNNTFQIYLAFNSSNNINSIISNIENYDNKIKNLNSQVNLLSAVGNLNTVSLTINSNSQTKLYNANKYLMNKLKGIKNLSNLSSNLNNDTYQKEIILNNKKLNQNGLTSDQVLEEIAPYFIPQNISGYTVGNNSYSTYIYINNLPNLNNITITNLFGKSIPLSSIASIQNKPYTSSITYQNGIRAANINALISSGDTQSINNKINNLSDTTVKKYGVSITNQGSSSTQTSSFNSLYEAMGISIFIVLIIMIATFSSLAEPIAILFSLPVTIIGILVGLYITRSTLNLPALIGALMLIGIVVTNAIVLLTKVRQNIDDGMSIHDALIEGGRIRLRPILMTAITTIFALLPLALFASSATLIGQSLAITVIGGLFSSTFLTLIIVPVIYASIKKEKID